MILTQATIRNCVYRQADDILDKAIQKEIKRLLIHEIWRSHLWAINYLRHNITDHLRDIKHKEV